jgi:hypothetical protein
MIEKLSSLLAFDQMDGDLRQLNESTLVFLHMPWKAPQAYLHVFFRGVSGETLNNFMLNEGMLLPPHVHDYLMQFNGGSFFQGSLSLFGITNGTVSRDPMRRQPFDIRLYNKQSRPSNAKPDEFYIGGYDWDGSLIFVRENDSKVYRRDRKSGEIKNTWISFDQFLEQELMRIRQLVNRDGTWIDPNAPTCPLDDHQLN